MSSSKRNRLACTFPSSCQTAKTQRKDESQIPSNTGQIPDTHRMCQTSTNTDQLTTESHIEQMPTSTGEDTVNFLRQRNIKMDDGQPESAKNGWATWKYPTTNQGSSSNLKFGERSLNSDLENAQNKMAPSYQFSSESQASYEQSMFDFNGYRQPKPQQNANKISHEIVSSSGKKALSFVSSNKEKPVLQDKEVSSTTNNDNNTPPQVMELISTTNDGKTLPQQYNEVSSTSTSDCHMFNQNKSNTFPGIYSPFGTTDLCAALRSQMSSGKDLCPNDDSGTSDVQGLSNIPASKREEVHKVLKQTNACLSQGSIQFKQQTQTTDVADQDFPHSDQKRNISPPDKAFKVSSDMVSGVVPKTSSAYGGARPKVPIPKEASFTGLPVKTPFKKVQAMKTQLNLQMQADVEIKRESHVNEFLPENSRVNEPFKDGFQDVRPKEPNLFKCQVPKDVFENFTPFREVFEDGSKDIRPKTLASDSLLPDLVDSKKMSLDLACEVIYSKNSGWTTNDSWRETKEFKVAGQKDDDSLLIDFSEDAPIMRPSTEMLSYCIDFSEKSSSAFHREESEVARKEGSEASQLMEPDLLLVELPEDISCPLGAPTEGPSAKETQKHSSQADIEDSDGSFSTLPSLERAQSSQDDPGVIITTNAKALLQKGGSTANFASEQSGVTCENVLEEGSMPCKFVIPKEECQEISSFIESLNGDQELLVQGDDINSTAVQLRYQGRRDIGMDIKVLDSDNVQVVKNLQYNKFEVTAESINNIKSQTLAQLNSTKMLFVESNFYEDVEKILEKEHVVFLIGPPSSGKRMTSMELLRKYQDQDFEPFIVGNVAEIREIVNTETKQAIYFPNFFGPFEFDQQKCDEWTEYFNVLRLCGFENKKYIFSSKSGIFQRGRSCLSMFNFCDRNVLYDICLPTPPNYGLCMKRNILIGHLSARGVKLSGNLIDIISECETNHLFPKLCEIFASNRNLHTEVTAVKFFKQPILYYKNMVRMLSQRTDKTPFAVLYLLMLYGRLKQSFGGNFQETEAVNQELAVFDINMSWSSIQEAAESMLGSFVTLSEGSYVFISPCVYDAVALVLGEKCPKTLIQLCSAKFLSNNILVAKEQVTDPENQMVLEKEKYDFLAERLVQEVRKGNLCLVSQHKAFTYSDFIRPFVLYCQKQDDFGSLICKRDQFDIPWLYWASWSEMEHLFKWILESYKDRKIKMKYSEMGLIVRACCISGNSQVLKIAFDTVKKLSALVSSPKKESIRLPGDMVVGNNKATQNDGAIQVGYLLHTACLSGHVTLVKLLVEKYGAKTELEDDSGYRPINFAARHGHLEIVKYLMSRGVKMKHVSPSGKTVLQDACKGGQTEVVEYLVKECPELVKIKDCHQRQPIHHATLSKDPKMVHFLLASGAKPESEDNEGNSAVHTACMTSKNLPVLKELKPSPTQINKKNHHGRTCLHLACKYGGRPMVSFLLHREAEANVKDHMGQTPLHLACEGNKKLTVEKLVKMEGIDIFVLDLRGASAMHLTTDKRIKELFKKL